MQSSGVVTIANSTGATITRATNNNSIGQPAEAKNEIIFQVSGSFGASFAGLSISVNAGANWTQYLYFRIWGGSTSSSQSTSYKFIAASYS